MLSLLCCKTVKMMQRVDAKCRTLNIGMHPPQHVKIDAKHWKKGKISDHKSQNCILSAVEKRRNTQAKSTFRGKDRNFMGIRQDPSYLTKHRKSNLFSELMRPVRPEKLKCSVKPYHTID